MGVVRATAVAAAVVLFAGCSGSDGDGQVTQSCESVEAKEYAALEAIAQDALADVTFVLERRSSCEETGSPGPSVVATVEGQRVHEVRVLLREDGWEPDESGALMSPDGNHGAFLGDARSTLGVEVAFRGPVGYWAS